MAHQKQLLTLLVLTVELTQTWKQHWTRSTSWVLARRKWIGTGHPLVGCMIGPQISTTQHQCQSRIDETVCSQLGVNAKQYVARVNTEFQKIGLRGTSLLAASGDSGANGRTDGECTGTVLHSSFPGSSPYITAVGATQLQDPVYDLPSTPAACTALASSNMTCASGGTEVAVSSQVAGFTSGG